MGKSQELYNTARKVIPGGTQLLSKRPEMFLPEKWPAYYSKVKGCHVWDLDGNEYMDAITMGIGSCILGYADDDINAAVKEVIDCGSMSSLNAPEEVELAELLLKLHPWAESVRYAKSGGESLSIAVRIARAHTKKDVVLFCGYHGWSDWYLSANLHENTALDGHLLKGLEPLGVPRGLLNTAKPFMFNDLHAFKKLVAENKGNIAAVVLEPIRDSYPYKEFMSEIRRITAEEGIVLIIDEVTAGFRICCGGSHLALGITPDIAVLAKAIANGYPMAAIIGKKEVMEAAQLTFISSTFWTERIGLAAAVATIKKYQRENVSEHLNKIGKMVHDGWIELAAKHGMKLHVSDVYPILHFAFEYENSLVLKTLFTQEMLKKGFLASNVFYASFAHKENDVKNYLSAVDSVFEYISQAIKNGNAELLLDGPVCHEGFQRLT